MTISITAFNVKGETLFLGEASWTADNSVYAATAGDAIAFMGKARSGLRYDDANGVWIRNRVARFELRHSHGGRPETCPRTAKFDAYCRTAYAERGCTVYATYTEAKAAERRAETFRQQWERIWHEVHESGDQRAIDVGLVIAMENASATIADEGLTNQDERWFETAIWTWNQWEDTPWGVSED